MEECFVGPLMLHLYQDHAILVISVRKDQTFLILNRLRVEMLVPVQSAVIVREIQHLPCLVQLEHIQIKHDLSYRVIAKIAGLVTIVGNLV